MSILVACVGNIFQGDDGFGCEVAKVLAGRPKASDVRVVDFGIRGLDLTYAVLDAPDLTILVDAVTRGGAPGTLYTIEPDLNGLERQGEPMVDAHVMDPVRALRAAQAMGCRFRKTVLVGCEPEDLGGEEGRMGLTAAVQNAIESAARLVEQLIEKERTPAQVVETG